ncbi:MAG: hypothetical protein WDW36_010243 [Sanguina aurantia]
MPQQYISSGDSLCSESKLYSRGSSSDTLDTVGVEHLVGAAETASSALASEPHPSDSRRRVAHSPREKSLKRQAAELLLASRYTQTPRTPHHSLHGSHHHPTHPHSLCSSSSVSSYSTNVSNTPAAQQKHAAGTIPSPGQQQQPQPQQQAFSSVVALAASLSQKAASASAPHLHKAVPTATSTALQQGTPHVHAASVNVAACAADCSCKNGPGWCQFKVVMPHVNWQSVFESCPTSFTTFAVDKGYEKVYMSEGLQVLVVEDAKHVDSALAKLRASMTDQIIAIDLEWRPETGPGQFSPVATLQLSSSTVAVVIRTSSMAFTLPEAAKVFLADPNIVIVGFSWDGSDEAKLTRSFSIGRSLFKNFFDLQSIANELGYSRFGLARLTKQVMGQPFMKSKAVSRSNWAARKLTMHQVKYAALDVFTAGQVFRGLRLWHSSPSPCSDCRQDLGTFLPFSSLACGSCSMRCEDWTAYYSHCVSKGHLLQYTPCASCGRMHRVEGGAGGGAAAPAGGAPGGQGGPLGRVRAQEVGDLSQRHGPPSRCSCDLAVERADDTRATVNPPLGCPRELALESGAVHMSSALLSVL